MCWPRIGVLDANTDLDDEPDDEPPLLELLLDDEPHALSASTTPIATAAAMASAARLLVGMEPVLSFMRPLRCDRASLVELQTG